MLQKHPPSPNRIRKIPKKFSWVDHKLVRDRHIHKCSHKAAALYLFLITVADDKGLSYYADLSIEEILSMDECNLKKARQELIHLNLMVYKKPFYQILPLDDYKGTSFAQEKNIRVSNNKSESIGHILKNLMEKTS